MKLWIYTLIYRESKKQGPRLISEIETKLRPEAIHIRSVSEVTDILRVITPFPTSMATAVVIE